MSGLNFGSRRESKDWRISVPCKLYVGHDCSTRCWRSALLQSIGEFYSSRLVDAAAEELDFVRSLGSNRDLMLASANQGAWEALLIVLSAGESGIPVYQAVEAVESSYSSRSGIVGRMRAMRASGLLDERSGKKRSQVCLVPSPRLIRQLGPVLTRKYEG